MDGPSQIRDGNRSTVNRDVFRTGNGRRGEATATEGRPSALTARVQVLGKKHLPRTVGDSSAGKGRLGPHSMAPGQTLVLSGFVPSITSHFPHSCSWVSV